jgi:hypothetical protein
MEFFTIFLDKIRKLGRKNKNCELFGKISKKVLTNGGY